MNAWDTWKRGFDAWEDATATLVARWMQSPLVLSASGAALSAALRAKAQRDAEVARWWAAVGLPTRRDQERLLHAVNQLHSRIGDLEERLADAEARAAAPARQPAPQANEPPTAGA